MRIGLLTEGLSFERDAPDRCAIGMISAGTLSTMP